MKKAKLFAFSVLTSLMALVTVSAKEMTLTELGNEALKYAPNARFIFVVGKYAYTSTYDQFSTQDIMLASADSIDLNKNGNVSGQVGNMTIYRIDRTYNSNNTPTGWKAGKNEIGKGTELNDNKVDIKYIDYHSLSSLDIDAHVNSALVDLNKKSADKGFSSITYTSNSKTATFNISEPSRLLADYKETALEAIKAFVSANGATTVTYKGTETKLTEENLDEVVTKLAAQVLRDMAGVGSDTSASSLNYASVANKSAQATVKYVDEDGNTVSVTYTLNFVYNFKEEKNKVLTDVAKELNETIKTEGNKEKYGFNGVTYSNEKLTFDVYDPNVNLANFADSGIIQLFKENYAGATTVVLKMGEETETIEIDNQDLTDELIKKYAAQVLLFMSGSEGDDLEAESAKDLTIKSVIGKSLSAEVTYADGKTKVTYTLEFNFDADEVKDEILTEYAEELNKNEGFSQMGFSSVDYDDTTNTVTFNISDPDGQFFTDGDEINLLTIQTIVGMFNSFAAGATDVTYTVNGTCADKEDECMVTFDDDTNTQSAVMQLAFKVLSQMVKGDGEVTGSDVKVGSVAGSYAEATFNYVNGEPVTYRVEFKMDAKENA